MRSPRSNRCDDNFPYRLANCDGRVFELIFRRVFFFFYWATTFPVQTIHVVEVADYTLGSISQFLDINYSTQLQFQLSREAIMAVQDCRITLLTFLVSRQFSFVRLVGNVVMKILRSLEEFLLNFVIHLVKT